MDGANRLIWAVLAAGFMLSAGVGSLLFQQVALRINRLESDAYSHAQMPSHPGASEALRNMDRQIEALSDESVDHYEQLSRRIEVLEGLMFNRNHTLFEQVELDLNY